MNDQQLLLQYYTYSQREGYSFGIYDNVFEFVVAKGRIKYLNYLLLQRGAKMSLEKRRNAIMVAIYSNARRCLELLLGDQPDDIKRELLDLTYHPSSSRFHKMTFRRHGLPDKIQSLWIKNKSDITLLDKQLWWALLKRGTPTGIIKILLWEHKKLYKEQAPVVIPCHIIHHALNNGSDQVVTLLVTEETVESWTKLNSRNETLVDLLSADNLLKKQHIRELLHSISSIADSNGNYPYVSPDRIWRKKSNQKITLLHLSVYHNHLSLVKKLLQLPVYSQMLEQNDIREDILPMCQTYSMLYELTRGKMDSYSSKRLLFRDIQSLEYYWYFSMLNTCVKSHYQTYSCISEDALGIVLNYCEPNLLLPFSRVCKQWMKAASMKHSENDTIIIGIFSNLQYANYYRLLERARFNPGHISKLSIVLRHKSLDRYCNILLSLVAKRFRVAHLHLSSWGSDFYSIHYLISSSHLQYLRNLQHAELDSWKFRNKLEVMPLLRTLDLGQVLSPEQLLITLIQLPLLENIDVKMESFDLIKAKEIAQVYESTIGSHLRNVSINGNAATSILHYVLVELDGGRIGRSIQSLRTPTHTTCSDLLVHCPNLEQLEWRLFYLASHDLTALSSLKKLKVFSITGNGVVTVNQILMVVPWLKYLRIVFINPSYDELTLRSWLDNDEHNLEYLQTYFCRSSVPRMFLLWIGSNRRCVHVINEESYNPVAPSLFYPSYQDYVERVLKPSYLSVNTLLKEHEDSLYGNQNSQ